MSERNLHINSDPVTGSFDPTEVNSELLGGNFMARKSLNRRDFLKVFAAGGAGLLAACTPEPVRTIITETPVPTRTQYPTGTIEPSYTPKPPVTETAVYTQTPAVTSTQTEIPTQVPPEGVAFLEEHNGSVYGISEEGFATVRFN